jgi:hypothetical protein
MVESFKIPKLAQSAASLLVAKFNADLNALGAQTVEAMGHEDSTAWSVDFRTGLATRDIPDPPET